MTGKRQDPLYQAQAILSHRDHSQVEITRKLHQRGFGKDEIAKTIAWLQEKNLLDDHRFAQAYVESILRSKPVGPRYLSAKLKQKGVADDIIREVLSKTRSREADLAEQASAQWKRIHPKHAEDKQRLYRFLASRGFSSDVIGSHLTPSTVGDEVNG